jgi:hypothetical protein
METEWQDHHDWLYPENYIWVCKSSTRELAIVRKAKGGSAYDVFVNGASYGSFQDLPKAKVVAEGIVAKYHSIWLQGE